MIGRRVRFLFRIVGKMMFRGLWTIRWMQDRVYERLCVVLDEMRWRYFLVIDLFGSISVTYISDTYRGLDFPIEGCIVVHCPDRKSVV